MNGFNNPYNGTTDAARRKNDLLASVQHHDWKPTELNDLMEFSEHLLSFVNMDVEERFFNMILGRLYFDDLPDRYESIPQAHQDTFQWIFERKFQRGEPGAWDNFPDWLSSAGDKNVYWTTGKPGSGKSTLMKFMFNDERTTQGLQNWAQDTLLIKAGFFLWNSGTVMQMSRMGLLRSLLHTALECDKLTLLKLFKSRWQQYIDFGGGRQPFTWHELRYVSFIHQP